MSVIRKIGYKKILAGLILAGIILGLFGFFIHQVQAVTTSPIRESIGSQDQAFNINHLISANESALKNTWKIILGLTNVIVLLLLIVVGFSTVFKIQIDTYHIKKAIIPVIVGIILANFSLVISKMFLDFANILTANFVNSAAGGGQDGLQVMGQKIRDLVFPSLPQISTGKIAFDVVGGVALAILVGIGFYTGAGCLMAVSGLLILIIWLLTPSIFFIILAFLFYIRNWLLIFLIAISPLAFLCISFSPLQSIFKKWWDQFIKWTFMVPVSFFFLWLAVQSYDITKGSSLGSYLFGLVILFLAISAPLKMGGAVMAAWSGVGKKLTGALGGLAWNKGNLQLEKMAGSQRGKGMARSKNPLRFLAPTSFRAYKQGLKESGERYQQEVMTGPAANARARADELARGRLLQGGSDEDANLGFFQRNARKIFRPGQSFSAQSQLIGAIRSDAGQFEGVTESQIGKAGNVQQKMAMALAYARENGQMPNNQVMDGIYAQLKQEYGDEEEVTKKGQTYLPDHFRKMIERETKNLGSASSPESAASIWSALRAQSPHSTNAQILASQLGDNMMLKINPTQFQRLLGLLEEMAEGTGRFKDQEKNEEAGQALAYYTQHQDAEGNPQNAIKCPETIISQLASKELAPDVKKVVEDSKMPAGLVYGLNQLGREITEDDVTEMRARATGAGQQVLEGLRDIKQPLEPKAEEGTEGEGNA